MLKKNPWPAFTVSHMVQPLC